MGKLKKIQSLYKAGEMTTEAYDTVKGLILENAVLCTAGKFNPVNAAQVVLALNADYGSQIEYDDVTGELIAGSVERALERLVKAEPNLFQNPGDTGSGFRGRPMYPGDMETLKKNKAAALKMLGI